MLELGVLLAAEFGLLAAVVFLREPKLLIPAAILGLPMEYFNTEAMDFLSEGGVQGAVRALLNPGKAAMLATLVVAAVQFRHEPHRLFPESRVLVPIVALLTLFALGVLWSDSLTPPNSVLILPMYVAFVFVAPAFIEDRRDLERILGAILLAAILLSALAIAQRLFGVFNWRAILIQSDEYSYRSNATFADPNNLARFLAIAMSLAAGLVLATGPRRLTLYLAIPAWCISAIGIVATASRSGWLMLLFCTFVMVCAAPIARWRKFELIAACSGTLGMLLALLLFQGGTDAERVKSLSAGVAVLGQREFLIEAGLEMWRDNPLLGVGSGNYESSLVTSYLHILPEWARNAEQRTVLSHTSFATILAELGIVGMVTFVFVGIRIGTVAVRTYFGTKDRYHRLVTGWVGASLLGIVLHSQSEGRLTEEPYLWLLLAVLVALETRPGLARERVAEREPGAAAAAQAEAEAPALVTPPPLAEPEPVAGA